MFYNVLVAERRSAQVIAGALLVNWQKNTNGAADCGVATRKVAMQRLEQDLHAVVKQVSELPESKDYCAPSADPAERSVSFLEELMTLLMDDLAKVVFKGIADPVEACR